MERCDGRPIGFGQMDTLECEVMEAIHFEERGGNARAAIITALEREVKSIVKSWHTTEREHEGHTWRIYNRGDVWLVSGGIGAEAGRRAAEAMVTLCQPDVLISLGFAGALEPDLKVGDLFVPRYARDVRDNSLADTESGSGTLVSLNFIASAEQKAKLRQAYAAQAVDMEAAAVAHVAQAHGLRFMAVKAISDDKNFDMPDLNHFVRNGEFSAARFVVHFVFRPWLWPQVMRLAKNSAQAAKTLSSWLNQYNQNSEFQEFVSPGPHLN